MANDIIVSCQVQYQRENETTPIPLLILSGKRLTQSGDEIGGTLQTATTTAANLNVGGVTSPKFAIFRNLDTTNYFSVGWDDSGFVEALRIPAGWPAIVPLSPSRTWQVQSNTADVPFAYQVLDE